MFEKIRRFIGKRAFKKYYAEYLHEELGLSKKEAWAKAYAVRPTASRDPRALSRQIVSAEDRHEADLAFVLALAEVLLQQVLNGDLTREELHRFMASDNPFREIRLKGMTDKKLEEMLVAREAQEQKEVERAHGPAGDGKTFSMASKDLFKQVLFMVQGVFKQPEGPSAEEVRLQQQKRKQYILEKERMDKIKMAALANSPEFLESLGAPDHFDSARQQGKREERIIAKEQQKLRPRLSREDIAPVRPREKTPKEIAEEKLRMVRKMKEGLGGFGSSV